MKKILFLGTSSSIHVKRLINSLSNDFEISFASIQKTEKIPNVKSQFNYNSKFSKYVSYLKLQRNIKPLIKKVRPDLLFSMYSATYGIIGYSSKFSPHIVHAIGSDITKPPFFLKRLVKTTLKSADKIFTLMDSGIPYIKNKYDVDGDKIVAIDWGINLDIFRPYIKEEIPENIRLKFSKIGIKFDERYLISPRSCRAFYRIMSILKSYNRIKEKIIHNLIIMKSNANKQYWQKILDYIRKNNLEERVILIEEFVNPEEMAVLYSISDITISFPKRDFRPPTLFEAMACESFIIVSDLKVQKYLVNNSNCFKAKDESELGDKIIEVLEHKDLKSKICKKNLNYVLNNQNYKIQTCKINSMVKELLDRT